MTWSLAGLVVATAAVWLSLRSRTAGFGISSAALTGALALALAVGLSSLIAFWWAVVAGGLDAWFTVADAMLWTLAAGAFVRLRSRDGAVANAAASSEAPPSSGTRRWVPAAFALVAVLAAATAAATYRATPYGHPDATLIWNLKALFMLRGGDAWTGFVDVPRSNPSHPLLVSAAVARLWQYEGEASTLAAAALGMAMAAAVAGAVIGALDAGRIRAWLAGAVVLAPPTVSRLAVGQTADLACGLYLLLTVIVLFGYGDAARLPERRRILLAGLLAGLMAWTKNEGLVFLAAAAAVTPRLTLHSARSGRPDALPLPHRVSGAFRPMAWLAAGAAPALAAVAWLKGVLAPAVPEYFAEGEAGAALLPRVFDLDRHAVLMQTVWRHAWHWGGPVAGGSLPLVLGAALAMTMTRGGRPGRYVAALLVVMMAAYYAVWTVTPLEPVWLVGQTFDRLLVQLWPSLVLVAFAHATDAAATIRQEMR